MPVRNEKSFRDHLSSSADLVTKYEATRAGFIELALEKSQRKVPFISDAKALKVAASRASKPNDLLKISEIEKPLLTAAGISDKALKYLTHDDKLEAINRLIKNFLEPAGNQFVEELVYRFLLTKGDQLGGMMRNLGGVLGERKLSRAIISALNIYGISFYWYDFRSRKWILKSGDDTNIEMHLKGISWEANKNWRTLIYNKKVPLVNKNVDLCLLNVEFKAIKSQSIHREPSKYIALGELKGGIDPAGADEHWKTANSALERIRKAFENQSMSPLTFFVGAAIQNSMAEEIFSQLKSGTLANAANLTNDDQVSSLCQWVVTL
ncbi:restriction endonuclease [candidate division KSB1 bacterium 4484_188]|nr:MAG: restriction endonuclease [candidate division KSB1 bacterium 4484_188]